MDKNHSRKRPGCVFGIGDFGVEVAVSALADDDIMEDGDSRGCDYLPMREGRQDEAKKGEKATAKLRRREVHCAMTLRQSR
jgi:hypothetical protein